MLVIVISLINATKRRQEISKRLKEIGLEFEFFDAIYGTTNMYHEKAYQRNKRKRMYGYDLKPGEIGCYKSHQQVWQKAAELTKPILVLEDDTHISASLPKIIAEIENNIAKYDFDILRLSGLMPRAHYEIKIRNLFFTRFFKLPVGAQGYIIKPQAARVLLNYSRKIFLPIDEVMDQDYLTGLKVYATSPYLVEHNHVAISNIGPRDSKTKSLKIKCYKEMVKGWWSLRRFYFTRKNYLVDRFILKRVINNS